MASHPPSPATPKARKSEIETLLLSLWRSRRDPAAIERTADALIKAAPGELPYVEMYLPQFAHMVIALADDLPVVAPLEKFILSVCQLSLHVALQFFWIVYASLQENRLKNKKSDRTIYKRCARLLVLLEQCVVYGGASASETAVAGRQQELMDECVSIAGLSISSHARDTLGNTNSGETLLAATLLKKGGGTTRCGRRNWNERYFEIKGRTLYYYMSQGASAPRASISLETATVAAKTSDKYPNYFEVLCRQSGTKFQLQAHSREEMVRWCLAIRARAALPEPPGMRSTDVKALILDMIEVRSRKDSEASEKGGGEGLLTPRGGGALTDDSIAIELATAAFSKKYESDGSLSEASLQIPSQPLSPMLDADGGGTSASSAGKSRGPSLVRARGLYAYFNSQREFIRALTNLAEELRFLKPDARQAALQPRLDTIQLPAYSYFPLAHSAEKVRALLRFTPNESVVINTKARCPIILYVETRREAFPLSELTTHLNDVIPTPRGGPEGGNGGGAAAAGGKKKGETWEAKVERLRATSPLAGSMPGWELASFIVKSNDDLRQEVFIMQMMRYLQSIWDPNLTWLNCYHIEATGPDTGLIETITGSSDLDRIKKQPGYTTLRALFVERYGPPDSEGFVKAQTNFAKSLAAYSIVMWILKLRDRHNGNLMLDEQGRYFHIDFGFCLGHSTGKGIGGLVECSPFKLTEEYIEVLDGRGSPMFQTYCQGCISAMAASHAHADTILSMIEIVGLRSGFPCFQWMPVTKVMPALAKRLMTKLPAEAIEDQTRRLIYKAAGHWGSRQYDWCQNKQRGIAI